MLQAIAEECERIIDIKLDRGKIQERKTFLGFRAFVKKLNEEQEKKSHINDFVVVVSVSRSVIHSGTKSVSVVEKSALGRRIVKLKRKICKNQ